MIGCVVGCQYIPSVEYFAHWKHHGHIHIERHEHYQKRTWRNKTAIPGPDVPLVLTVPLRKGKHQQANIADVRIAYDTPWQKTHLHSLKAAFGKSAFFEEVLPDLERIYQTPYTTLWELNEELLQYIISLLNGLWTFELTKDFQPSYPWPIKDLRSGVPCGRASDDRSVYPEFVQVQRIHKTHQPNLCILDALCHLGPETNDYLSRYSFKLYDLS